MRAGLPRGQAGFVGPNTDLATRCVDRWELLSLITKLRKPLGLKDREIMVLRAHLSVLPHGPLDPAKLNVSFMSVTEILVRACGMDERRFRRGEERLEEVGLIHRNLSGNGRRFPERNAAGEIVNAYGIDLAPLLDAHDSLVDMLYQVEEERRALRAWKNALSARLAAVIKALSSFDTPLPSWLDALRERTQKTFRRKEITKLELNLLEIDIQEAEIAATNSTSAVADNPETCQLCIQPAPTPSEAQSDEAQVQVSAEPILADESADDDGQNVRHIESKPKYLNLTRIRPDQERDVPPLWSNLKTIPDFFPSPPSSQGETLRIVADFSLFIGLGQKVIGRALESLGLPDCLIAIDYLAENITKIRNPEGYLISMLKGYENGRAIASGRINPKIMQ
jgi:replication initiation protein RepC